MIIALHGLKKHLGHTYRQLLDVLSETPRIVRLFVLSVGTLPHFTTPYHAKERLNMPNWRRLLDSSAQLHDFGDIQASTRLVSIGSRPAASTLTGRITGSKP